MLLPTDSFETVEKILACLRAQPRAGRLEIVLVAPPSPGSRTATRAFTASPASA